MSKLGGSDPYGAYNSGNIHGGQYVQHSMGSPGYGSSGANPNAEVVDGYTVYTGEVVQGTAAPQQPQRPGNPGAGASQGPLPRQVYCSSKEPVFGTCPQCSFYGPSVVISKVGLGTWILCGGVCLSTFILGPLVFLFDFAMDKEHQCQNCGYHLGTKRIFTTRPDNDLDD